VRGTIAAILTVAATLVLAACHGRQVIELPASKMNLTEADLGDGWWLYDEMSKDSTAERLIDFSPEYRERLKELSATDWNARWFVTRETGLHSMNCIVFLFSSVMDAKKNLSSKAWAWLMSEPKRAAERFAELKKNVLLRQGDRAFEPEPVSLEQLEFTNLGDEAVLTWVRVKGSEQHDADYLLMVRRKNVVALIDGSRTVQESEDLARKFLERTR